jgi:condensin complex subunit 1
LDKQLPKPQRRGAIIILEMLALARRSVVTERVDMLLRVGLGPLGKVGSGLEVFFLLLMVDCI